ncbi:MAG: response regulator transcription factor [Cryomorphaceae bacterium]|nr:response regulator transcription factor [Cryomorphaceae bacterium]
MTAIESGNLTIALIEDEKKLADSIVEFLEMEKFHVLVAYSGKDGLDMILKNKPDFIMCDVMMPGSTDGIEVLQSVRRNPELKSIPFVFLTAKTDRSDLRKGMEFGADDYITKPFSFVELLNAIKTRLARKQELSSDSALESMEISEEDKQSLSKIKFLTPKEKEILKRIANGERTIEMSEELFISPKTIENHRYSITRKLDLKGQGVLLKFAMRVRNHL